MIRLLRYNFRALMYGNWWLIVFPVAASQLVVFWNLVTLRFEEWLPAHAVETVSPLLAAFLCAHVLSAEYRSGVGAILASKPVHIGKIVAVRMSVALGLVWALACLSLVAFYYGWQPYPMAPAAVAVVPSTLFAGLLALTFATMFRNPWAGFATAVLWWSMDRPPGPLINPFLSLRSYSASIVPDTVHQTAVFTQYAWQPKLVLLVLSVALYLQHRRLVFSLGSGHTTRLRRRAVVWTLLLPVLYALSGATIKVGYLYTHRGRLLPDDTAWIRTQLSSFGPIPVARLFGSPFSAYVGDIANTWRLAAGDEADVYGDTVRHRNEVAELVRRGASSVWGSNLAELHARLAGQTAQTPEDRIKLYRIVVDKYPRGPHASAAYVRIAREYADMKQYSEAMAACESALKAVYTPRTASDALRMLTMIRRDEGDLESAAVSARRWMRVADDRLRFKAGEVLFDILQKLGRNRQAAQAARATLAAIAAFEAAIHKPGEVRAAGRDAILERDAASLRPRLEAYLRDSARANH